ncbi:hypothetical protein [Paenibacillus sp. 2003]|uniref:hypothetical protein n=1 Tax=Paenibacillus TaxID=44249 RepID=UPI0028637866|nr:hypothetical protein [Paenibacillus sp. 2003]MDR6717326.1 hypothetical protein [Paenibacillus sp. 2003]
MDLYICVQVSGHGNAEKVHMAIAFGVEHPRHIPQREEGFVNGEDAGSERAFDGTFAFSLFMVYDVSQRR